MTLKEILKQHGIAKDVIETIIKDMTDNKIYTSSEENLDIRYGKLKEQHEALEQKDVESQKLIKSLQEAVQAKMICTLLPGLSRKEGTYHMTTDFMLLSRYYLVTNECIFCRFYSNPFFVNR